MQAECNWMSDRLEHVADYPDYTGSCRVFTPFAATVTHAPLIFHRPVR